MAATTTPELPVDGSWKLIHSATEDATLSLAAKFMNQEVVNHDSGTNAPGSAVKGGYDVLVGKAPLAVPVKSGDHIWGRFTPTGIQEDSVFKGMVVTVG